MAAYGEELPELDARLRANELLKLYALILRPLPEPVAADQKGPELSPGSMPSVGLPPDPLQAP